MSCSSGSESYTGSSQEIAPNPLDSIDESLRNRLELRMKLYDKFMEVIETRHRYPIVKEYKSSNCTIRRRPMNEKSGIDLFILERVDYGMTPKAYTDFQVTIRDFCTANRLVKSVDVI